MKGNRAFVRLCALMTCGTALGGPAWAQSSPEQSATRTDDTAIADIVVTARKREESLQDVPIAITAVSGQQLTQSGVNTLADIGRAVPGLSPQPHPSAASIVQFQLRGQSAGDVLLTIDQAVGVYLDGVYVARTRGLNGAFFDLERVEVLKGPQGTLYGRNTTGGAISIVTRGADFNGVHGYVSVDSGEYDMFAVRGAVNVPIVEDKLAIRLAAQGFWRDGFGQSAITGQDIGQDRNQQIYRASLLAQPTETFRITLKGEYYKSRENNTLYTPIAFNPTGGIAIQAAVENGGGPFLGAASFADPVFLAGYGRALAQLTELTRRGREDIYTSFTQIPQVDDNDVATLGATLEYDISDAVTLKSITGYRWFKTRQIFDLDATPFQGLEVGFGTGGQPIASGTPGGLSPNFSFPALPEQNDNFFSQELNLSSVLFDDRLNLLLGAYYSRERGRDTQIARVLPALTGIVFANDGHQIRNDSWSLFAQGDFKITDTISITGGGRYTEEDKGLTSRNASFNPATGNFVCTSGAVDGAGNPIVTRDVTRAPCEVSGDKTFTGWSYLASINWQPNQDLLFYAKTARGFRGGAFQLRSPDLAPAGPEQVTDYEVGAKADLFGRMFRANIAAYRSEYKNKQESIIIPRADGSLTTVIQNAATATIKGFEGEFTLHPTRGLTLGATVNYIEGKYGTFLGALPIEGGTPVDASGERFSLPPWRFSLTGRYEVPVSQGHMGLQVDYSWIDGARPSDRLTNNTIPEAVLDHIVANVNGGAYANGRASLGLMNARLDFTLDDQDMTFAIFATNVLDKKYQFSGIDPSSSGVFAGITGAPRMLGVSVRKGFGGD